MRATLTLATMLFALAAELIAAEPETKPEEKPHGKQYSFAVFRFTDYQAMTADRSLDDARRNRDERYKPIAFGIGRGIPSNLHFSTTDFDLSFRIRGEPSPDKSGYDVDCWITLRRPTPPGTDAVSQKAFADSIIINAQVRGIVSWRGSSALFTRAGRPEDRTVIVFSWFHSM